MEGSEGPGSSGDDRLLVLSKAQHRLPSQFLLFLLFTLAHKRLFPVLGACAHNIRPYAPQIVFSSLLQTPGHTERTLRRTDNTHQQRQW